jgi:hypothetical protein
MKPSLRSIPLAALLLSTTTAFPLVSPFEAYHNRRDLSPRASYSVVAVDGGHSSTPGAPAPTATVTNLITRTQTILAAQLSTVVITQGASPKTIVVTVTSASATTIVETPPAAVVTQITPVPVPQPTTVQGSPVTLTVTATDETTPETRPFDDGQWHTTYFYTVPTPASSAAPLPSASPSGDEGYDDGSWAKWASDAGQWQGPPRA